jgi:quercetin dioxygenase-like cupin family protein
MTGKPDNQGNAQRFPVVVHPADLRRMDFAGLTVELAFEEDVPAVENQRVLVQRTYNDPGDMSDWHVHPKYTTYGYQLSGNLCVEFGPGGSQRIECGAGDFVRIPAGCVQREGAFGHSVRRGIGVRIGSGPAVVDVDGPDSWTSDAAQTNPSISRVPLGDEYPDSSHDARRPQVVREADLDRNESRDIVREIAFEEALPAVRGQRVLVERSFQEAGARSTWRVHPKSVWYGYQITGRLLVEFGPEGRDSVEAGPGDFVRIPAGVVHRVGAVGLESRVGVGVCIGDGDSVLHADCPPASPESEFLSGNSTDA